MRQLLVATGNVGKLGEFRAALEPIGIQVVGLDTLPAAAAAPETGATFEENARLKAETWSTRTALPVLADDSGLVVDALEGRPGILSARYGGPHMSDRARCLAVLKGLVDVPEPARTARFRCVLALARAGRTFALYEGMVEGIILRQLRGKGGFGYDPVFLHPESGRSFAELEPEAKRRVSHRGRALDAMIGALRAGQISL